MAENLSLPGQNSRWPHEDVGGVKAALDVIFVRSPRKKTCRAVDI